MPVFRILASRTELYLIETYVRAVDPEEAEMLFYNAYENEESAIAWTQDFDSSDIALHSIEPVPGDHFPVPSSDDRSLCLLCGRIVSWTGMSAEESPTGSVIPGPWVHVDRPIVAEGLGL
jgi:hypothetical protein